MEKKNNRRAYIVMSILSVFIAFPVVWMILMSIRPNAEIFSVPPHIIPKKFTLQAYRAIFTDSKTLRFFFNSYFIGIVVTLVSLFLGILSGYGFSRFRFKGKKIMNVFIIMSQTIPPISLLIPYYIMIVSFKLYNTYTGLVITYASFCLPYCMLMMISYFNTISEQIDEAVIIDGGSRFYALWRVLVPIAIPGIVSTAIYSFMLSWNEYLFALTLTKSDVMRTVPIGISLLQGENQTNWSVMMSMAIVGSVPILILYLVAQKYFVSGLSAGSVKG